jgi:hypothetical protein
LHKHLAAAFLNDFSHEVFVGVKGIAAEGLTFESGFG